MARPAHVRAAVETLLPERHAWTVDSAHAALSARGQAADRASVHRALTKLVEDGAARRFDVGDGRAYFERSGDHHEHVVCDECGLVAAIEGCVVREPSVDGFTITGHSVTFSGRCATCSP